jgi:hypothetical protein
MTLDTSTSGRDHAIWHVFVIMSRFPLDSIISQGNLGGSVSGVVELQTMYDHLTKKNLPDKMHTLSPLHTYSPLF